MFCEQTPADPRGQDERVQREQAPESIGQDTFFQADNIQAVEM
jgi:hypothetical protein